MGRMRPGTQRRDPARTLAAPWLRERQRGSELAGISSFANSSWTRTDGLAWLGELQTHSWRNGSDTIRSLKPWSRGTFSDREWKTLQQLFRVYRDSFTTDVKEFAKMLHLACELRDRILGRYPRGENGHSSSTGRLWLHLMRPSALSTLF
ncbi:hypothetical protein P7K49_037516 [Saguinus oedipus]|uniref:MHC class I-like antigen recognition-like domain-containing protein n=1 Tax=Saguinus oedipus TaxID=9490 RepID=A0ABQ9TI98_SAGOE|nr:hypothetical protein P7K49_037516 [Saguinus oedipus]